MNIPSTYNLDIETLKLSSYRLLCLFYGNKEIARTCDPDGDNRPASLLERQFFSREMTHLLLGMAIAMRVFDDQMQALNIDNPEKDKYLSRIALANASRPIMFTDMSLRDACNKIIHATVVEPHSNRGTSSHELDEYNWLAWTHAHEGQDNLRGPEPEPITWHHLSGFIRLGGSHKGTQWWHLLDIQEFVNAIYNALSGD